jgi:Flp pilus assembly protein TadG
MRDDRPTQAVRSLGGLLKQEAGSGLVEYAIIFMVFMTMLLGIADFGRALYAYHFVSNAAREATRYASVRGQTCITDTCWLYDETPMGPRVLTATDLTKFVQNVPLGIDQTKVSLTPDPVWSDANEQPGSTVQVTVSYNFNFVFPFVYNKPLTLTSQSQTVIVH